jgi:hypothetical protein
LSSLFSPLEINPYQLTRLGQTHKQPSAVTAGRDRTRVTSHGNLGEFGKWLGCNERDTVGVQIGHSERRTVWQPCKRAATGRPEVPGYDRSDQTGKETANGRHILATRFWKNFVFAPGTSGQQ